MIINLAKKIFRENINSCAYAYASINVHIAIMYCAKAFFICVFFDIPPDVL